MPRHPVGDREKEQTMLATMADAHREWHLNAGVPMGTPGCPQDACHPPDEYDDDYDYRNDIGPLLVRCGNHAGQRVYHGSVAEVRSCYGVAKR